MNKTATLLGILCAALLGSNAYLLYVNHRITSQANESMRPPKLNAPISPIIVHGKQGKEHPLVFNSNVHHDHLLLVMSPDCPFCEKNWPMWDTLIKRVPSDVDVTYFDVTGKFDKQLSEAHHIKDDQLVTAPVDAMIRAHFVGTPTTILIANNGKVRHVWEGVLNKGQLGEIVAMSQTDATK